MSAATPAAAAAPAGKKKGPVAAVWGSVLVVIGVLVGLTVLAMIPQSTLPMFFSAAKGTVRAFNQGAIELGVDIGMSGNAIGILLMGLVNPIIRILIYLVIGALLIALVKTVLKKLKGDGGDAHH
jgi:hypothetical protein